MSFWEWLNYSAPWWLRLITAGLIVVWAFLPLILIMFLAGLYSSLEEVRGKLSSIDDAIDRATDHDPHMPGVLVSLVQNTDAMRRSLDMAGVVVSLVQNTDAMRRSLEEIERRLARR